MTIPHGFTPAPGPVTLLDCTVRDGGLMNNSRFSDDFVRAVYQSCLAAGVDIMEIGYKSSDHLVSREEFGPWKFSRESDIRRVIGDKKSGMRISVMADVGRADLESDLLPRKVSAIDMIRVACYDHQLDEALRMVKICHDKGYETTFNLMAISVLEKGVLERCLEKICQSEVQVIYLVDSYGSFHPTDIRQLSSWYIQVARDAGKYVGIHTHNNQQLAYANTLEAMALGVSHLDCTLGGLGRGAGNCPTELLLGSLKKPGTDMRPLVNCLEQYVEPMHRTIHWGFDIPYMLTGQRNLHPKAAMDFLDSPERHAHLKFFDSLQGKGV